MDSVIKHLVEITGHRDHDLLNISVITALKELLQAESARVFEVVSVADTIYLNSTISVNQDKLSVADDHVHSHDQGQPLSQFPALQEGISQHSSIIEAIDETGQRVIWLPIWINDKVHTCLQINKPASYSSNTQEVVSGMLIVYRNFQNLLDYSERDSLTGLLNRKTFDDNFSKVLRQQGQSTELSDLPENEERRRREPERQNWLAVLDIDHFKRVNDQFGHLYGDEVLILVANLLRSSFRPGDRLFRFGGEEFVVLLRSTTLDEAQQIFERFRSNVEQHHFPQVGQVTISIGFARIVPFEPAVAILGRADQALYHAKSNGRNQVCYYESLVSSGALQTEQTNDDVEFF